ncbi:SDR family NAD(P)-dependent oxidoreductase [Geobacter sp. SVR]|uniref:SDR family NAD(P)-dependent oxidoreductase n=1 Tax=Geobacter sp. SVR TaxID=2495594 RepID=UPI00143F016E|nr:SDR family oxidoreductase [Geobacter sp. SVR]BCS55341.1 short-chain dehydrogenase [Geobacter sp. SVR]GCF87266.1 oxidoreductase [Geobacter sp. SVR]
MNLQLIGKKALISGSTKGIGLAVATLLANEGARVIVNGRSEESVSSALERIRKEVPDAVLEGFCGDLAEATTAGELLQRIPIVDILVNNLGIYRPKPFEEIQDDEWRQFFEVNVLSAVRLARGYLPGMKERNWGRIVFISSESGIQIPPEMVHYGMTKTALLAVSRGIAETCAGTGVTSNAILPGPTRTAGVDVFVEKVSGGRTFDEFQQDFFSTVRPTSLLRRFATPEEVAALVAYVCSPLSSATNGAALRVDGGVVRSCF